MRNAARLEPEPELPGDELCWRRGHHGPFRNHDQYAAVPGWRGFGDCSICGSTCWVGPEGGPRDPFPLR